MPAPERSSLTTTSIVYLLLFASVGGWVPYASVYFQFRGVDLGFIGVLSAIPFLVAILGAPAWGLVADRLGDVRPPMLVASLWAATASLWLASGPPMPWLAVAVAVLAAGSVALNPLLDARTVQRLGARYGQARMWGSAAFVVASVAFGVLVQATSPASMLFVYAGLLAATGVAAVLLLGRGTRPPRAAGVGPLAALRLLRAPAFGLFFIGSVAVWTAAIGVLAFFSLRVIELGGDARLVGIAWAVTAITEIPAMLVFRRLSRRISVERLLVIGAAIFVARSVLWSVTDTAEALVVIAGLGGPGFGLFLVGTVAYVSARAPAHLQATAQALFAGVVFALGNIVGAVVAGVVAGALGLAAVFPVASAIAIAGAGIVAVAVLGSRATMPPDASATTSDPLRGP